MGFETPPESPETASFKEFSGTAGHKDESQERALFVQEATGTIDENGKKALEIARKAKMEGRKKTEDEEREFRRLFNEEQK